MCNNESFRDINEKFFFIENKYQLFDKQISGIYFWELIRFDVNREILIQKGLISYPHIFINKFIYGCKKIFSLSYTFFVKNPFYAKKETIFIFGHSRRQPEDGCYTDVYTDMIKKRFTSKKIDFQDFEGFYPDKKYPYSQESKNILMLDTFQALSFLYKKKILLKDSEKDILTNIKKEISNEFGINIDIFKISKLKIRQYLFFKKIFTFLLKIKKPKAIFEVVGYTIMHQGLNGAAKEFGIQTIELQHGVVSKYHLGFSVGNNPDIEKKYSPDTIYTWGKYWNTCLNYGKNVSPVSIGFPHFDMKKKRLNTSKKNKKNILVISQGAIGKELTEKMYGVAQSLSEYTFYYKLHPGEFDQLNTTFLEMEKLKNVHIITSQNNIYDLFGICSIQIGVFSTAIYEGLGLGLQTIVFDISGVEYLDDIIEKGYVRKVEDSEKCITCIQKMDSFKEQDFNSNDFFREESLLNIGKEIWD